MKVLGSKVIDEITAFYTKLHKQMMMVISVAEIYAQREESD